VAYDEQPPVYVTPGPVYGAAPPVVYAAPPAAYAPPLYAQGSYQAGYQGGYQGGYVARQRVVAPIDAYASTVVPRPPAPVPYYARPRY
jgi:hypothetical protein